MQRRKTHFVDHLARDSLLVLVEVVHRRWRRAPAGSLAAAKKATDNIDQQAGLGKEQWLEPDPDFGLAPAGSLSDLGVDRERESLLEGEVRP